MLGPDGRPYRFGYDATQDTGRRRIATPILKSEDDQLPADKRKKLLANVRDVRRNFVVAGWMVRQHINYVATFNFQAPADDQAFNDRLETFVRWWGRPQNCDAAGRHSLGRLLRLWEGSRTVDGDVLLLKLDTGLIQTIEGDRVRTPYGSELPQGVSASELKHGVQTDKYGKAKAYAISKRKSSALGEFTYERMVRAAFMEHHGYFDRPDQIRGISPLAGPVDTLTVPSAKCQHIRSSAEGLAAC